MTDRIQELEAVIREAVHALNVARWPDVVAYDSAGVAAVHAALTAVDAARVRAVKEARTDEDGAEVEATADRAAVNLERDGAWALAIEVKDRVHGQAASRWEQHGVMVLRWCWAEPLVL